MAGERFKNYELLENISSDASSTLHLALDPKSGKKVALRVFRDTSPPFQRKLDDVATVVSFVKHPAINAYVEHGTTPAPYLATEWIEGESLETRLSRAPLLIEETIELARKIGNALIAALGFGLFHGAIDARKIRFADPTRPVLIGLGLSLINAQEDVDLTMPNRNMRGLADARAWGRTIYRCVTGVELGEVSTMPAGGFPRVLDSGVTLPPKAAELIEALSFGSIELAPRDVREAMDQLELALAPAADTGLELTKRSDPFASEPPRVIHPSLSLFAKAELSANAGFTARYAVRGEIARGGMGVILDATDVRIRRQLALKMLLEGTGGHAELGIRFLEEAQIQGQLEHPNICPVHELGLDEKGHPYFTMKKVRGRSLGDILRELKAHPSPELAREFSLNRRLEIFLKVCDAIAFAHSKGVVHRDLKPDNIMVGEFGEVLVMDWGLAKIPGRADDTDPVLWTSRRDYRLDLSVAGHAMGTPQFMPPEQAQSAADVDHRADIYALGAILYQILSFEPPIQGDTVPAILLNVVRHNITPPAQRAPEQQIPADLEAATMKAMSRAREDRYPTAALLRDDIQSYLDGRTVSAAEYSFLELWTKWFRRNRIFVLTAATALVLLVASGAFYLVSLAQARNAAERRLANALLAEGKARAESGRWAEAQQRYRDAMRVLEQLGEKTIGAELAIIRANRYAPPPLYTLETGDDIRAIGFVGGGERAVTGGAELSLWDVASAVKIRDFDRPENAASILDLELSPDGGRLVVLESDGAIRAFDVESGAVTATIAGNPADFAVSIALLADGVTLLAGHEFGDILRFDISNGRPLSPALDFKLKVSALATSGDGNLVIAGGMPARLVAWPANRTDPIFKAIAGTDAVDHLALASSSRKLILTSNTQPSIQVADLKIFERTEDWLRNPERKVLSAHGSTISSVSLPSDGSLLVSADQSGLIIVWELAQGTVKKTFVGENNSPVVAAITKDGSLVLSGDRRGRIQLWPVIDRPAVQEIVNPPSAIFSATFLAGDRLVATADMIRVAIADGRSRVPLGEVAGIDLREEDTSEAALMKQMGRLITRAAFSGDGGRAALARTKGPIELVDVLSGEILKSFELPGDGPHSLAIARDGSAIAATAIIEKKKSSLVVFDTRSDAPPKIIGEHVFSSVDGAAVFSPDGRFLLFGGTETRKLSDAVDKASIWNLEKGALERELRGHTSMISAVAYAPDGKYVYTAGHDRTIRMWSVETGTTARVFRGDPTAITAIAISPDGGLLASGNLSGAVRLWDVDSGVELDVWPVFDRKIKALTFSSDASKLLAGNELGAVGFFELDRVRADPERRRRMQNVLGKNDGSVELAEWYGWWDAESLACRLAMPPSLLGARCRAARGDLAGAKETIEDLVRRGVIPADEAKRRMFALAENPAQKSARDPRGRTELHLAVIHRDTERVRALLDAGADPNSAANDGRTIAADAALRDCQEIMKLLAAKGAKLDAGNSEGLTPLVAAIQQGHVEMIQLLISLGANVNRHSEIGTTPLQRAVAISSDAHGARVIETLLAAGAAIDRRAESGYTALQFAVELARPVAVKVLLANRAAIDLKDEKERTALSIAVDQRLTWAAEMLLESGANANLGGTWERPLHTACKRGDDHLAMMLLDHGADLEAVAGDGTTPLTSAILSDHHGLALALVKRGADPRRADALGRAPLFLLVEKDAPGVLRAFAQSGVNLEQSSLAGVTLLQHAVRLGKARVIEELLVFKAGSE